MISYFLNKHNISDDSKLETLYQLLVDNMHNTQKITNTAAMDIEYELITRQDLPNLDQFKDALTEHIMPWHEILYHAFSSRTNLIKALRILTFRLGAFVINLIFKQRLYTHTNFISTIAHNLQWGHYKDSYHIHKSIKTAIYTLLDTPISLIYTDTPHKLEKTFNFFPTSPATTQKDIAAVKKDTEKLQAISSILQEIQLYPTNYHTIKDEEDLFLYQIHEKDFQDMLAQDGGLQLMPTCCMQEKFLQNIVTQIQAGNTTSVMYYLSDILDNIMVHNTQIGPEYTPPPPHDLMLLAKIDSDQALWCTQFNPCSKMREIILKLNHIYSKKTALEEEDIETINSALAFNNSREILISILCNLAKTPDNDTCDVLKRINLRRYKNGADRLIVLDNTLRLRDKTPHDKLPSTSSMTTNIDAADLMISTLHKLIKDNEIAADDRTDDEKDVAELFGQIKIKVAKTIEKDPAQNGYTQEYVEISILDALRQQYVGSSYTLILYILDQIMQTLPTHLTFLQEQKIGTLYDNKDTTFFDTFINSIPTSTEKHESLNYICELYENMTRTLFGDKPVDFKSDLYNSINAILVELPSKKRELLENASRKASELETRYNQVIKSEYLTEKGKKDELHEIAIHLQTLCVNLGIDRLGELSKNIALPTDSNNSIHEISTLYIEPYIESIRIETNEARKIYMSHKKNKYNLLQKKIQVFLNLSTGEENKLHDTKFYTNLFDHTPFFQKYFVTDLFIQKLKMTQDEYTTISYTENDSSVLFKLMCLFSLIRSNSSYNELLKVAMQTIKNIPTSFSLNKTFKTRLMHLFTHIEPIHGNYFLRSETPHQFESPTRTTAQNPDKQKKVANT